MRRTVLLGSLFLAVALVAMSGTVLAQQGNRTQTASHEISGELLGSINFVDLPLSDDFPYPYNVASLGVVAGQVKGLGNSNVFTFHVPTPQGTVMFGRFFIMAADGDKIQGTYEGTTACADSDCTQVIGTTDWVITGGTGRFANATGTIHATAYVIFAGFDNYEWPATWVLEGTIDY
jgi:hypothetical protein